MSDAAKMNAAPSPKPPMSMAVRLQLSVMMFLQFAVWGAFWMVMGGYADERGFGPVWGGWLYATMSLGAIVSPMFIGQIADRYFSSEKLMAALHLLGAGLLYALSQVEHWVAQDSQPPVFFAVLCTWALVYSPTLSLSNSIAFSHIPDGERDFPGLRVLGTVGWIAVNLIVGRALVQTSNQPIMLAAGCSFALGLLSLVLPHTPPAGKPGDALPFLRALGLMKDGAFAVFFSVSFVITIVLAFYFSLGWKFLGFIKIEDPASTMTIGQFSEMIILPFLPIFLRTMGMKWVLAVGMLAWGVRYALFAYGEPLWLMVVGVGLHGVCFDFFFAAGFIYVDQKAPAAIRASGQALFTFLTYGLGMFLGSILSGYVERAFTVDSVANWRSIWLVPAVGVLGSWLIFVLFFRERGGTPAGASEEAGTLTPSAAAG
jgi:nucleoside transporter